MALKYVLLRKFIKIHKSGENNELTFHYQHLAELASPPHPSTPTPTNFFLPTLSLNYFEANPISHGIKSCYHGLQDPAQLSVETITHPLASDSTGHPPDPPLQSHLQASPRIYPCSVFYLGCSAYRCPFCDRCQHFYFGLCL